MEAILLNGVKNLININKLTEKQTIIFLIIIGFLVRITLSPFFVMFPHVPHDFYMYIGGGQCMAEGKFLEIRCPIWSSPIYETFAYGPLLATLNMVWYLIFGSYDFLMFKLPSIIFDTFNVLMVYFIGKRLFNKKLAFYLSLIYSFSFIALYNSAVIGNDENIAMFFILVSTYFLIEKKLPLSAFFIAISVMFKNVGLITLPVFLYYILKKYGSRPLFNYILLSGTIFLIILSPFIFLAGLEKATFFILQIGAGPTEGAGMSFPIILKYATSVEMGFLMLPMLILGYLISLSCIFIFKMKNSEAELLRNMAFILAATFLLGSFLTGRSLYMIFPFLLILFGYGFKGKVQITKKMILGALSIFISLLIYSIIYRWGVVQYSMSERIFLLGILILVPMGVFNLLHGVQRNYRLIWTFIILGVIIWEEVHASPLLALPLKGVAERLIDPSRFTIVNRLYGDHIQGDPEKFLAYGTFFGGPAVILWICLGFLCYTFLKDKFKIRGKI